MIYPDEDAEGELTKLFVPPLLSPKLARFCWAQSAAETPALDLQEISGVRRVPPAGEPTPRPPLPPVPSGELLAALLCSEKRRSA